MSDTIFDKIVRGQIDTFKIWEDDSYLAFLTPFANTPGQTVVIPKTNQGDYVFHLSPEQIACLMVAVQHVASILETAFNVKKVALVFEGEGVPYVHAKLYPLHGDIAEAAAAASSETQFNEIYLGYISTVEGPHMSSERLAEIQQQILGVQK